MKYHDGTTFPAEITSVSVWEDGRFAGTQGTVRDMTQQERLERELRDSQDRYRFLVENSPDVVFSTDADGRFTFMSESMRADDRLVAGRADRRALLSRVVDEASQPEAMSAGSRCVADPASEQVGRTSTSRAPTAGSSRSRSAPSAWSTPTARFAGIHGATRDISERDRLERELRRQAGELAAGEERAHLARELHDSVTQALFSMTLVSRSIEMLLDRDPAAAQRRSSASCATSSARRWPRCGR